MKMLHELWFTHNGQHTQSYLTNGEAFKHYSYDHLVEIAKEYTERSGNSGINAIYWIKSILVGV